MKKIVLAILILGAILGMSSCDYDDSNDIDFITPTDSASTALVKKI